VEKLEDEDHRVHGSVLNDPGRIFLRAPDWRF